jgi:HAD domain in Swiss Army Knife RNA repair proteins
MPVRWPTPARLMASRPLALVDIDGVLNPYAAPSCPPGFSEYRLFPNDAEPHWLCPTHGEWLRELAQVFDLVWASAWGTVAQQLLGPILDLDDFPFVPMPPIPFPPREKVAAIENYVGDRAVAWIDDVLEDEARQWAQSRPAPTLLVPVDPAVGITRRHVEDLLAWASGL